MGAGVAIGIKPSQVAIAITVPVAKPVGISDGFGIKLGKKGADLHNAC
jgi:hypothetical protein